MVKLRNNYRLNPNMLITLRRPVLLSLLVLQLAGCASALQSAQKQMFDNLAASILNSDDPETVRQGAPAYLILIDSFINTRDASPTADTLMGASRLYSAYAGIFVTDSQRASRMSQRALDYALRAICMENTSACQLRSMNYAEFAQLIDSLDDDFTDILFTLGSAWAGWIEKHSDDWNARAELARVDHIISQVVKLDDTYQSGQAHLYLGILKTLLPPALGGKPEVGKQHFEKAISLSGEKNLMAMVYMARSYARLVFDRQLHDKLLQKVIRADPYAESYTLTNILAQQQAQQLLKSASEYF